ncbi:MAG: hypothetical protein ACO3JL_09590 [Myxococcota bacterium]
MARLRLGEVLVQAGLIDEMQVNAALAHQRQWGGQLGSVLVEQGYVDEIPLYDALAAHLGVRRVSLPDLPISPQVATALPAQLCQEKMLIPVGVDDRTLVIATDTPQDVQVLDDIAFRTGLKVRYVVAPPREIEWAIRRYHFGDSSACPPPATRAVQMEVEEFKIVDMAGHTVQRSIDDLRREHDAKFGAGSAAAVSSAYAAGTPAPTAAPPPVVAPGRSVFSAPAAAPPPPVATPAPAANAETAAQLATLQKQVAEMRTTMDKQAAILRAIVSLCGQKGLISYDELRAAMTQGR